MYKVQNETLHRKRISIPGASVLLQGLRKIPLWVYTLAAVCLGWECYAAIADQTFLPRFSEVAVALWGVLKDGSLPSAFLVSMEALVVGYALSVIVGVGLGLVMGYKRIVDLALTVYLDLLTAVPMVALVPVVVVFFGLGLTARVTVVFLFAVVIIAVNTREGVKQSDSQLLEMARSYGASARQTAWKILLPSALPFIAAGLRMGLGRAIVGMVTAEMIYSSVGIGQLMMAQTSAFRAKEVFAIVLSLLVFSATLLSLVQRLENRMLKNRR